MPKNVFFYSNCPYKEIRSQAKMVGFFTSPYLSSQYDFNEPSTSIVSSQYDFNEPSTSIVSSQYDFNEPSTSIVSSQYDFNEPSTSIA